MNNRIKEIRKELRLTQQEFADRIGIKRNTVANYETGRNEPVDSVCSLIVREFNVNETWLRTGVGEMFTPVTRDEEIAQFAAEVIQDEGSFRQRFVSMLARLGEEEWAVLEKMALDLAEKKKKD